MDRGGGSGGRSSGGSGGGATGAAGAGCATKARMSCFVTRPPPGVLLVVEVPSLAAGRVGVLLVVDGVTAPLHHLDVAVLPLLSFSLSSDPLSQGLADYSSQVLSQTAVEAAPRLRNPR